jgi:hypothetical protein
MGLGLAIGFCALLGAKPKQLPLGARMAAMPSRNGVQH